ncbi:universal stress protein [Pseudomonas entomophila]|jgi:nucleotide-binding universal stress UspA family protein|uniref:universal stress protein n=1 Tax=Pseudomonas entomophila TaxID=312306 RepID=UPI0015E2CE02|nr:universal stress protein [Pseudomonas entomophila]MBA1194584.1 universal stress protein [Pseudomonas entomophila]
MPRTVLIAIDASAAAHALLALAERYCQPQAHELHVLLAIDATFAVHERPAAFTEQELDEFPAACEEQRQADQAMAGALRRLREAGFACKGTMLTQTPVEAIVTQAATLDCELIIMGHRHLSRLGRLLDPSISAKVIDQVSVPVLVGVASGSSDS